MLSVRPIRRRKISDDVAEQIEFHVRAQGLEPGDPLPSERELMSAFSVGRSAVREAIFSLSKRGLVTVRNGEKARVSAPNIKVLLDEMGDTARRFLSEPTGIRHLQDARLLLEVGTAERAATNVQPADIPVLYAALLANERAMGNQSAFELTDFAFHQEIARIARNPIFPAVNEALFSWLIEQRNTSGRAIGAGEAAYRAHRRIFEAILKRDAAKAAEAMRAHLTEVINLYWAAAQSASKPKSQKKSTF
jgi:DNA-binding FadR family transcriptional regulator